MARAEGNARRPSPPGSTRCSTLSSQPKCQCFNCCSALSDRQRTNGEAHSEARRTRRYFILGLLELSEVPGNEGDLRNAATERRATALGHLAPGAGEARAGARAGYHSGGHQLSRVAERTEGGRPKSELENGQRGLRKDTVLPQNVNFNDADAAGAVFTREDSGELPGW